MQESPASTLSEGWIEVPYKTHVKQSQVPGLLHVNPIPYKPFNNYSHSYNKHSQNMINSKPVSHHWNGFTRDGDERWIIELDNGNLISSKDNSYNYLVKKYFPSDIIR